MKKIFLGSVLMWVAYTVLALKPTHNEIATQNVRWFEMKFKEEKLPNSDKRLRKVYLLLGFRHHLNTNRESAYLSLYVLTDKDTIDWKRYMFLEGSSSWDEEPVMYKVETFKEEEALNRFTALAQELYRLDFLDINSPEELVAFYQKNFQERRTYYFVLRDKLAVLPFVISQKDFDLFFKSLAQPCEKNLLNKPKKMSPDLKEKLLQPYNLLDRG